jgi:hypothetical protein
MWTPDEVLGLAPDARSARAARALADAPVWSQLGAAGSLVFGRCQGSGREPYQVTVDLAEPAFRCTCPSRKEPCKHGLALLVLWAAHGAEIGTGTDAPAFAEQWAAERAARAAAAASPVPTDAADAPAAVADPEARAKRRADREAVMTAGLDELERWLGDLVRQGLAGARRQPYRFWDAAAARLVDAQVPALAERVRGVAEVLTHDDWADALLAECGRWELAIEAWRRRDRLDPATLGDLRVYLGWPWRSDETATFPRLADRWVVAGVRGADDGRVASQRTWLWGMGTGRWVVVLDFAATGTPLRVAHLVGTVVDDAVAVYPGSDPTRALLSAQGRVEDGRALPPGATVDAALDQLSSWLAANPWRGRLPVCLRDVTFVEDDHGWWVRDAAGDGLPLAPEAEPWLALATSGGEPVTLTAEWEDGRLVPLAVAPAGELVAL